MVEMRGSVIVGMVRVTEKDGGLECGSGFGRAKVLNWKVVLIVVKRDGRKGSGMDQGEEKVRGCFCNTGNRL